MQSCVSSDVRFGRMKRYIAYGSGIDKACAVFASHGRELGLLNYL